MKFPILAAAVLAATAATPSLAAGDDPLLGKWRTEDGATVEIKSCPTGLCGDIVDLTIPPGKTRADMVDANNPAEAQRGRSLYGLRVVRKIQKTGGRTWSARVYSPKHGRRTDAKLTLDGGDALTLRGCVKAVIDVCRDETWHRLP